MKKEIILVRGIPGSGKSTLAKSIGGEHLETDMFFMENSEYKFDASKLKEAHILCQTRCEYLMTVDTPKIVVSNTFTEEWEMGEYIRLAKKFKYTIHTVIVENRHNGVNEHNVPEHVLTKMKNRFQIQL